MSFFRKRSLRFVNLVSILAATVLLSSCAMYTAPQTTFVAEGNNARAILDLFKPVFWIGMAVFVIVEALLIWSVIRYRRRPEDGIPLQIHGNTPIEIAWTILPAIIVVGIATLTFRTQAQIAQTDPNPLEVTVIGHQWWWEFRYPEQGIVTANELHIPAGREVRFSLRSDDVIHSFWLPRLSGKTDAIPGHTNVISFKADETSSAKLIRGECAEFCGGTHAMMHMFAVVQPPAEFDQWVAQQQQDAVLPAGITPPAQATAGAGQAVGATVEATLQADQNATGNEADVSTAATVIATATAEASATAESQPNATGTAAQPTSLEARGYQLFAEKQCVACHAIGGYPNAVSRVGPDLTHIGSRQHIVSGWLENTPENMRRWLRNPDEVKPGNVMASVVKLGWLKDDEVEALTAYLESLK